MADAVVELGREPPALVLVGTDEAPQQVPARERVLLRRARQQTALDRDEAEIEDREPEVVHAGRVELGGGEQGRGQHRREADGRERLAHPESNRGRERRQVEERVQTAAEPTGHGAQIIVVTTGSATVVATAVARIARPARFSQCVVAVYATPAAHAPHTSEGDTGSGVVARITGQDAIASQRRRTMIVSARRSCSTRVEPDGVGTASSSPRMPGSEHGPPHAVTRAADARCRRRSAPLRSARVRDAGAIHDDGDDSRRLAFDHPAHRRRHDPAALVEFLRAAFGAIGEQRASIPSQLRIGDSILMVSGADARGPRTAFLYVYVDDCEATYRRALAAGATPVEAPADMPYGDRRATVEDRWGNLWQIATHREDVPIAEIERRLGAARAADEEGEQ